MPNGNESSSRTVMWRYNMKVTVSLMTVEVHNKHVIIKYRHSLLTHTCYCSVFTIFACPQHQANKLFTYWHAKHCQWHMPWRYDICCDDVIRAKTVGSARFSEFSYANFSLFSVCRVIFYFSKCSHYQSYWLLLITLSGYSEGMVRQTRTERCITIRHLQAVSLLTFSHFCSYTENVMFLFRLRVSEYFWVVWCTSRRISSRLSLELLEKNAMRRFIGLPVSFWF